MGNALKKKLDECSCNSNCTIQKEVKDIQRYFKELSLDDLIYLKNHMDEKNPKIKMSSLL